MSISGTSIMLLIILHILYELICEIFHTYDVEFVKIFHISYRQLVKIFYFCLCNIYKHILYFWYDASNYIHTLYESYGDISYFWYNICRDFLYFRCNTWDTLYLGSNTSVIYHICLTVLEMLHISGVTLDLVYSCSKMLTQWNAN